jgi:hypothetical protein
MKSKKQKELSLIVTTLIIILMVSVAVGLVWIVVKKAIVPQYIITEEVCEEENIYSDPTLFYNETITLYPNDKIERNYGYSGDFTLVYRFIGIKTTCHEEEVDEIHIECKHQEKFNDTRFILEFLCEDIVYQDEKGNFFDKISKSDLSPEWLDENTECVDGDFYCEYMTIDTVKNETYCNYEIEVLECSTYKLGNYTITRK